MPAAKDLDPSASLAALIGAKVRKHRQRNGWTQRELGDKVGFVHNRIAQVELATDPPTWPMLKALDEALEAEGDLTELWEHMVRENAREAFPDWVRRYMELESQATRICKYQAATVPGLLQTQAYARALLRAGRPRDDAQLDERLAARLARQAILATDEPPILWVVLDEAVIRRPIGNSHVMQEQLSSLVDMAESPRNVIQVLPYEHGEHAALGGSLTLLSLPTRPDIAYLEGSHFGQLTEDRKMVAEVQLTYDLIRTDALSRSESADLLRTVMEGYRSQCDPI